MKMTAFETFVLLYFALEAANEEKNDNEVVAFLIDANPFLFEGESSADPCIFFDFKKDFESQFGNSAIPNELYSFVLKYLGQKSLVLQNTFENAVTKRRWIEVCNEKNKESMR